ncbi:hypothetical protein QLQ85_17395 [Halomonas sp. M4R5S39]|nr:hypothetical protein [Halomonas kalidii]MDI5986572.1 hypothetical protein [Halomonas kalidii]
MQRLGMAQPLQQEALQQRDAPGEIGRLAQPLVQRLERQITQSIARYQLHPGQHGQRLADEQRPVSRQEANAEQVEILAQRQPRRAQLGAVDPASTGNVFPVAVQGTAEVEQQPHAAIGVQQLHRIRTRRSNSLGAPEALHMGAQRGTGGELLQAKAGRVHDAARSKIYNAAPDARARLGPVIYRQETLQCA